MSTASVILDELRRGPRTTTELGCAAGVTANAVCCAVRGLIEAGHHIENLRSLGGEALYRLDFDAEHPSDRRCSQCGTVLNRYNPGPWCLAHRRDAAGSLLAGLDDRIEEVFDAALAR